MPVRPKSGSRPIRGRRSEAIADMSAHGGEPAARCRSSPHLDRLIDFDAEAANGALDL
jgi:hypothetical protein